MKYLELPQEIQNEVLRIFSEHIRYYCDPATKDRVLTPNEVKSRLVGTGISDKEKFVLLEILANKEHAANELAEYLINSFTKLLTVESKSTA